MTLGRALLDSGDAPGAVTELEGAAAQSPDNLAAASALDTARAALGDVPWPPVAATEASPGVAADLPLQTTGDVMPLVAPSLIAKALGAGPDGPQEFGLAPDWSLPDALPPLPVVTPPPLPHVVERRQPVDPLVDWPMDVSATHSHHRLVKASATSGASRSGPCR